MADAKAMPQCDEDGGRADGTTLVAVATGWPACKAFLRDSAERVVILLLLFSCVNKYLYMAPFRAARTTEETQLVLVALALDESAPARGRESRSHALQRPGHFSAAARNPSLTD